MYTLFFALFAAIPPLAMSSGVPLDESKTVRHVMTCFEEHPSPEGAMIIKVFHKKSGHYVELIRNNAGQEELVESAQCTSVQEADEKTFFACISEHRGILLPSSSHPYAYLNMLDITQDANNQPSRFVCEASPQSGMQDILDLP